MCTLVREFGHGDAKVLLIFRPGMFSDQMRMTIIRSASTGATDRGIAKLSMDGGDPIEATYIEGFNKREKISAIAIDVAESKLLPLRLAKTFRIDAGSVSVTLAPTAVPAAMKALEACQKELLVKWGMDASVVASIAAFPTIPGGVVRLFTVDDYPVSALRENKQGTSGVRFWVDMNGKVRDCQIVESSGSSDIDAQTCAIITKRARFAPARTKDGSPVESIGFQRVRWVIPS
jgi:TonB family protein